MLFNLTITKSKKYHDLESSVIPLFKQKFKWLQGPSSTLRLSRIEPGYLGHLLTHNKTR